MLIVLPPSETKAWGGASRPLDLASLSFPQLTPVRAAVVQDLARLTDTRAKEVLGLSDKQLAEAAANRELLSSATMPALQRYTGVLYDALDAPSLPDRSTLVVCSALFGLLRADDLVPHYRLSGTTKLPTAQGDTPTMKARWGTLITEALVDTGEFIVDLRSGTYQQLGKVPGAITVRVEKDGKVVSHFNKHYRGLVARELALAAGCECLEDVADTLRASGMQVEQRTATELCMLV